MVDSLIAEEMLHFNRRLAFYLDVEAQPAARPRLSVRVNKTQGEQTGTWRDLVKVRGVSSKKYKYYQEELESLLELKLKQLFDYYEKNNLTPNIIYGMKLKFIFNYPKSTPKKRQINQLHIKKPDIDNLVKPVLDATVVKKLIAEDGQIAFLIASKFYSTVSIPKIEISFLWKTL